MTHTLTPAGKITADAPVHQEVKLLRPKNSPSMGMRVAHWMPVLVIPIAAGLIAFGVSSSQTPKYTATASLLAGQNNGFAQIDSTESLNQTVVGLAELADDQVVIAQAVNAAGLHISVKKAVDQVTASVPANTQTVRIRATDTSPKRARDLANAVATSFVDVVGERSGNSDLSINVWEKAVTPSEPSSPRTKLNIVAAIILGFFGGLGLTTLIGRLTARRALTASQQVQAHHFQSTPTAG